MEALYCSESIDWDHDEVTIQWLDGDFSGLATLLKNCLQILKPTLSYTLNYFYQNAPPKFHPPFLTSEK
jgi:hypothetical protein